MSIKGKIYNSTGPVEIGKSGDKISFYGATPVVQATKISDAATQTLTGSDTVDIAKVTADLTSCKTAINAIIDALEGVGISASS